jgi:hypothetical protein
VTANLADLEARVEHALASADESAIEVLGYGEISSVLAWRDGTEVRAAKRLPLFDTEARVKAYEQAFDRYLAVLSNEGLVVVPTRFETTQAADGRIAAWCLQPMLDPDTLGPRWLQSADDDRASWLFDRLTEDILSVVTPRLGLDGQLSNWAVLDDEIVYFDVTTPMMRDENGREILDTELFLASLPWALRGLVRRLFLHQILDTYYDPRETLIDLLGNLIKEDLADRLELGLERVNRRVSPAIEEAEVRHYYRQDARMYALIQRLRRLDRVWQRRVRRRPYPFLLPGRVERRV